MKKFIFLCLALLSANVAIAQVPVTGSGDGLKGEYWSGSSNFDQPIPDFYRNTDFHTSPSQDEGGTFEFSRVDSAINFDWGSGNPFNDSTDDMSFSIRWTGYLLAPVTGEYTFDLTFCDDAFSLKLWDADDIEAGTVAEYDDEYIGGTNMGWNWDKDFWLVPASLEEGKYYKVELLYFENAGGSHINFQWFVDEYSVATETVPQSQLYSELPSAIVRGVKQSQMRTVVSGRTLRVMTDRDNMAEVYSANGTQIRTLTANGHDQITLEKGIYIVRCHGEKQKVVVR